MIDDHPSHRFELFSQFFFFFAAIVFLPLSHRRREFSEDEFCSTAGSNVRLDEKN